MTMQTDPKGSVSGQVVLASSDEPVGEATISVIHGAGPAPDLAPVTDSDGSFSLGNLPPGDWRLRACGPAGETGEAQVHVGADTVSTVLIRIA